jgi:hypothetical protein
MRTSLYLVLRSPLVIEMCRRPQEFLSWTYLGILKIFTRSDKLCTIYFLSYKVSTMLRNYAHHAQSPESSVHSMHKMQGKAIWQTLEKLSYRSSFWEPWLRAHIVKRTLTDHFSRGERLMRSTLSASISYARGRSLLAGLSRLVSDLLGRYVHEIAYGHALVETDTVNFGACTSTHPQNWFVDSPK